MPKIVYAPILEQAGFLKRKAADVVEKWVAQPDGATQYWLLSEPINLLTDDVVELSTLNPTIWTGKFELLMSDGNANYHTLLRVDPDTTITNNFGVTREGGEVVTSLALDGLVHNYSFVTSGAVTLTVLGAQHTSSGFIRHLSFPIFNLRVTRNGVVIHEIPLTNKAQGATQLATVGNVNAFMPNYTEAVWRKL